MPSPFPGMDPIVEHRLLWPLFHSWFMRKLGEQTLPAAKDRGLWIDVERNVYQRGPRGEYLLLGEPDGLAGPDDAWAAQPVREANAGGVALAMPRAVHEISLDVDEAERYKQDYLVVRQLGGRQSRVIAVVELLSYANKSGGYVPRYREKRLRFLESGVHFMEIDLLRFGENPSRDLFPELPATPYFIFVARKNGMGRHEEGYPLTLQEPLPVIGLPVGPGRADLPLDLAAAFRSAYDLAVSPSSINYETDEIPPPELSPEDAAWVKRRVQT